MGILSYLGKPETIGLIGHALQTVGATGRPRYQAALQQQYMQRLQDKRREEQYRGLLPDLDLTEQQRGILGGMSPEQGMGLLAERAFAQPPERKIIKGADGFNYFADTGERVLPNVQAAADSGNVKYGLNPLETIDPEGNTVLFQPSSAGGARRMDLPEGYRPAPRTERVDAGDRWVFYDRNTGQRIGEQVKNLEAASAATAEGTKLGEARAGLPQAESDASLALNTIKQLRNHPGRVHGWGARVPDWAVNPGSQENAFRKLHEQASGQVFLNAYQRLKGGGHITEVETEQAGKALSRLNRELSREEYNKALADLERVIKAGLARERRKARLGGGSSTNVPRETAPSEPSIDDLINQYGGQ